jgi:hypothetical protein
MRDRGCELNRPSLATTPTKDLRRGGSETRPHFHTLARSRTLQTHPRHASND